jgi:GNAT superfamily N-acetyltransferase
MEELPSSPRVRHATGDDVDALVELLRQLFAIEQDFRFDHERQRRGLRLLLDDRDGAVVLIAESAGRAVGMCSVQVLTSTAEGGPVGLVEDVVVDADVRGRGIGTALLAAAEDWARDRGLMRLQLLADGTNEPALRFYGKHGWSTTRMICLRRSW